MARSKAYGIGAMLAILVVSVLVLPAIVRFVAGQEERLLHPIVSGFQDMVRAEAEAEARDQVEAHATGRTAELPVWRPDPNTDYVCRSPNGGPPCPEGTFCDGASQSCVSLSVGGEVPTEGYYA
jgi:hypothetical protein